MIWEFKLFDQLTTYQLYAILQLRSEVFIVEQNCPYLDEDGKDLKSGHLMGWNDDKILVAYTRIVPAGISFVEASIGRVVSSPKVRGTGIGKALMLKSIAQLQQLFGQVPIRIGAQLYLLKFYQSLGFVQEGEMYLEDDIEHVEMVRV